MFKKYEGPIWKKLVLEICGLPKTGKTHLCLTAPGPIAVINTDLGVEGTISKHGDKVIELADYRVPLDQDSAKKLWAQMVDDYQHGLAEYRTVVVDTATEMWEMLRMAEFGKLVQIKPVHYTHVNNIFRNLIRDAFESPANVLFVHKLKPQYKTVDSSKYDAQWTGLYEPQGFKDMSYLAHATLSTEYKDGAFYATVERCRMDPAVNGLSFVADFVGIAPFLYPDTTEEDWK